MSTFSLASLLTRLLTADRLRIGISACLGLGYLTHHLSVTSYPSPSLLQKALTTNVTCVLRFSHVPSRNTLLPNPVTLSSRSNTSPSISPSYFPSHPSPIITYFVPFGCSLSPYVFKLLTRRCVFVHPHPTSSSDPSLIIYHHPTLNLPSFHLYFTYPPLSKISKVTFFLYILPH